MITPQAPQAKLKKVICPIVTVWVLFMVNLIIPFNGSRSYIFYYYLERISPIFFLFIIFGLLTIAILITLGIERNKYKLYLIGFIILLYLK